MDKSKKNSNIKTVLFVILGAVLGVIISFVLIKYTKLSEMLELTKTINGKTIVEKTSISDSVEKAKDAVVMISSYKGDTEASTGTGFVYKTDNKYGYIMTNQHVIENSDKVILVMSDDREV